MKSTSYTISKDIGNVKITPIFISEKKAESAAEKKGIKAYQIVINDGIIISVCDIKDLIHKTNGTITFTTALSIDTINPDYIFETEREAVKAAKIEKTTAFQVEWNGIDIESVCEIKTVS
jgi:hypothetical protein